MRAPGLHNGALGGETVALATILDLKSCLWVAAGGLKQVSLHRPQLGRQDCLGTRQRMAAVGAISFRTSDCLTYRY
eukprot:SAG11_NODE_22123_length_411_cov_3.573718_1_plen_76_part_00